MKQFLGWFFVILVVVALVFGIMCAEVGIALWLYGVVAVSVFGLPTLTFWQMFAMIWLFHILFSGLGSIVNGINSIIKSND